MEVSPYASVSATWAIENKIFHTFTTDAKGKIGDGTDVFVPGTSLFGEDLTENLDTYQGKYSGENWFFLVENNDSVVRVCGEMVDTNDRGVRSLKNHFDVANISELYPAP